MCNEQRYTESGAPIAPTRCKDYQRLKAILAPILSHADAHDYAPPLKFSVQQCRDIKERVNGI